MRSVSVSRSRVLGYRFAAQQLDRSASAVSELAVLDIGVQDSGADAARLAFDGRLGSTPPTGGIGPGEPLALVWSLRGAPHVHRRGDLDRFASALYPLSEADAAGRLNETGPSIARAGITAMEQYAIAVRAMKAVVRAPMGKGAASAAVTQRIPEVMWRDCRPCQARHISDSAMRPAALAAGLEFEPGTSPPVLVPRLRPRVPTSVDVAALQRLVLAYLTLLGPAAQADVAGYVDARRADIAAIWPDALVEVRVEGRSGWLPADRVDAMRDAEVPESVRLLGAFDPWLQARDRWLIAPEESVHKLLWPVLGRPGVVLVNGEILGVWRPKASGRKLALNVSAFAPLPPHVWTAIEAEAERVADVRCAASVVVKRVE
ncbi:MAG: crosslink repair DNA glycosylase YcaQ family protein [Jatrophihabitantaceae bacterium]